MKLTSSKTSTGQEDAKEAVRAARVMLATQQALWGEVHALKAALVGDLEENGFVPNFRRALES